MWRLPLTTATALTSSPSLLARRPLRPSSQKYKKNTTEKTVPEKTAPEKTAPKKTAPKKTAPNKA